MPEIQTAQTVQKLRTQYKVRTPFGLFLAGELIPVTVVDDLSGASVADTGHPRDCLGIQFTAAGGAGTNAQCTVVGIIGAGLIWKVHRVAIVKPTAGNIQVRYGAQGVGIAGLVNTALKGYSDLGVATQPVLSFGGSTPLTAAIDGVHVATFDAPAGVESLQFPLDVVLRGGDFLNIVNATANEALDATFWFTEFQLEDR